MAVSWYFRESKASWKHVDSWSGTGWFRAGVAVAFAVGGCDSGEFPTDPEGIGSGGWVDDACQRKKIHTASRFFQQAAASRVILSAGGEQSWNQYLSKNQHFSAFFNAGRAGFLSW